MRTARCFGLISDNEALSAVSSPPYEEVYLVSMSSKCITPSSLGKEVLHGLLSAISAIT